MTTDGSPLTFRDRDTAPSPVTHFGDLGDVLQAMLQSLEGGELHLRPKLDPEAQSAFDRYIEIGVALRQCRLDASRHGYLIERLKPHRNVIIGNLPAGVQSHGLLPQPSAQLQQSRGYRALEHIPDAELRQWLIDDGRLIYGEFKPYELDNYFDAIAARVKPGGAFIDLGSGLGRVVMSAALKLPVAKSIGVELLGYRHEMAQERFQKLLAVGEQALAALPAPPAPDAPLQLPSGATTTAKHLLDLRSRVQLIEQDMFKADVSQASLVFVYSTCFAPLMDALGDKLARELPEHCLVSTTTYALKHPAFRLIQQFPSNTLAWTTVFLYERVGALDTLPPAEATWLYEPNEVDWELQVRAALDAS